MTLVVFNGRGELGLAVVRAAVAKHPQVKVTATYFNTKPPSDGFPTVEWKRVDLGDHKSVFSLLENCENLAGVLHCAVPKHGGAASHGSDEMRRGIVDDVVNAAQATWKIGGVFVVMSTDQVFDGCRPATSPPYVESDPPTPCNPYGQAKVDMENALLKAGQGHPLYICRTSLILTVTPTYGKAIQFVVNALKNDKERIVLFTDEPRNMSFSEDLAKAMLELVMKEPDHWGILNLVSSEPTNRYELARLINRSLHEGSMENIQTGLSAESGLNRPLDLTMDTTKVRSLLKTPIRGISEYFKAL